MPGVGPNIEKFRGKQKSIGSHRKTSEDDGEERDVGAEEGAEDPEVVSLLPRVVRLLRVARERVEQRRREHAHLQWTDQWLFLLK